MTIDLLVNLFLVFFVGNVLGVFFASNVRYFVCIIFACTNSHRVRDVTDDGGR